MTIYILYHNVRDGHVPQWNYIPDVELMPQWAGPATQFDMDFVEYMPNTDVKYATIDNVPDDANWLYIIQNVYSNLLYAHTGLKVFDYFMSVPRLMADLLAGRGKIVYDDRREGYLYPNYVSGQLQTFFSRNNIPLDRVVIATGAVNAKLIFEQYNYCIHPLSLQQFELESSWATQRQSKSVMPKTIKRRFLCFNRRYLYRLHRLQLLAKIYKRGLLDQFYYSMLSGVDPIGVVDAAKMLQGTEPTRYNTVAVMEELESRMPMLLDTGDLKTNLAWVHTNTVESFYATSGISVVTETLFHDNEIFFSEKTWHPMRMQHPFIILNGAGALQQLQHQGYQTFSKWWDESYDAIVDPYDRLDAIEQLIADIAAWPDHKYEQFIQESVSICQHNLQHLSTAHTRISYTDKLNALF